MKLHNYIARVSYKGRMSPRSVTAKNKSEAAQKIMLVAKCGRSRIKMLRRI
jgi:hypothetical protein